MPTEHQKVVWSFNVHIYSRVAIRMTRLTDFFGGNGTVRKVEVLTTGTSWTVPADLADGLVSVTMIGGGMAGAIGPKGGQGGSVLTECMVALTPGASITYSVGAGGDTFGSGASAGGGSGSPTTFGSLTVQGGSTSGTLATAVGSSGRQNTYGNREIGAGKYGCYAPIANDSVNKAGGGIMINGAVYGTGGVGIASNTVEPYFSRPGVIYLLWTENVV